MSTRSGKRIHTSINTEDSTVQELKSERKTRSKRQKENENVENNEQKRKHYVRYPSEEGIEAAANGDLTGMIKSKRKTRRDTLKEQNFITADCETTNDRKSVRTTRRTKKFDPSDSTEINNYKENVEEKKKGKMKKVKSLTKESVAVEETVDVNVKKSKKKRNKKRSNSLIVKDITDGKDLNKSNISNDSFHSAAGSPVRNDYNGCNECHDVPEQSPTPNKNKNNNSEDKIKIKSSEKHSYRKRKSTTEAAELLNELQNSISQESLNKSKESFNLVETNVEVVNNATFENSSTPILNKSVDHISKTKKSDKKTLSYTIKDANNTFEVDKSVRNSFNHLNSTFDNAVISAENSTSVINVSTTNINATFNTEEANKNVNESNSEHINNITYSASKKRKSSIKNSTYEKIDNLTFEKEEANEPTSNTNNELKSKELRQSNQITSLNSTYEKESNNKAHVSLNSTFEKTTKLDTTFDKNLNKDLMEQSQMKPKARSSLISSDGTDSTSDITNDNDHISITSDDSKTENIINTTPHLIESSMDESTDKVKTTPKQNSSESLTTNIQLTRQNTFTENDTKLKNTSSNDNIPPLRRDGTFTETDTPKKKRSILPEIDGTTEIAKTKVTPKKLVRTPSKIASTERTPIKREGTFTKESEIGSPIRQEKTPRRKSLPSPGFTPFPGSKNLKNPLNVTRSIEKSRRSSIADVPARMTKVMFCSPVNNPAIVTQMKGKIIKSNLKGSNKSFVFDESVSEVSNTTRKRSYTQSVAEEVQRQGSVHRPSRPRTTSAAARMQVVTPNGRPSPKKPHRTKLPNFAALHQKQFDRMESLDECQERKAKRAKRLLTPTGVSGRTSPRETSQEPTTNNVKKVETPKSKKSDANPGYTRFGFKLNLDVNPFSIPAKTTQVKPKIKPNTLKQQATLPSLAGSTGRREIAKQTILREKSFTDKRHVKRDETRTVIKGVRTNRRFELQMKMRNVNDK